MRFDIPGCVENQADLPNCVELLSNESKKSCECVWLHSEVDASMHVPWSFCVYVVYAKAWSFDFSVFSGFRISETIGQTIFSYMFPKSIGFQMKCHFPTSSSVLFFAMLPWYVFILSYKHSARKGKSRLSKVNGENLERIQRRAFGP